MIALRAGFVKKNEELSAHSILAFIPFVCPRPKRLETVRSRGVSLIIMFLITIMYTSSLQKGEHAGAGLLDACIVHQCAQQSVALVLVLVDHIAVRIHAGTAQSVMLGVEL